VSVEALTDHPQLGVQLFVANAEAEVAIGGGLGE
jgi:hypothetical protein